jgi:hypothetical protein
MSPAAVMLLGFLLRRTLVLQEAIQKKNSKLQKMID